MATINLIIEELGPKGDGLYHGPKGFVCVDRALPGDHIRTDIRRDEKGVNRGTILEILEPSELRQKAPCAHYDDCGGCTVQHLKTKYYTDWKIQLVQEAFVKLRLKPQRWLNPIWIGDRNRRRATFSIFKKGSQVKMGYYRRRSDQISDIDECLIADPKLMLLRDSLKPLLGSILRPSEPIDVFLQLIGPSVDMVITGRVGKLGEPDRVVMAVFDKVLESSGVSRISWRLNAHHPVETIRTKGPIVASFGALKVPMPPAAFLQPTFEGEMALVESVLKALPSKGHFADLFSGCGTFSGPMLKHGSVDAYESESLSVKALMRAAAGHRLEVFRRDLFKNPLRRDLLRNYDAIVFDPPRSGCLEQVTQLALGKVPTLVGVSCNPATFARDARILCDGGYWLQSLQMVDQFLWSHHVEVVGVFTRQKRR